jgi:hypothetical protein
MKIAVASPPYPKSISDGLYWIDKLAKDAANQHASVVCFPKLTCPVILVWRGKVYTRKHAGGFG